MSELSSGGITAAAISAILAASLYVFKEYVIEPRRWKRNAQILHLEKRLEAYGTLLTILQSCARKGMRQKTGLADMRGHQDQVDLAIETQKGHLHLLENPHDADVLQSVFEKSHYLMSKELRSEWLKFVGDDEYFAVFDSHKNNKGRLLRADLWRMQNIVQKDYDIMEARYDGLVRQNVISNPFRMKYGGENSNSGR